MRRVLWAPLHRERSGAGYLMTQYQSNLVEAIKSWLSLTEAEKQQVNVTYKEKEHKFKLRCFNQLKNAKPFMKIKDPIRLNNVNLNSSSSAIQEPKVHIEEVRLQAVTEYANQIEYDEDKHVGCEAELVSDVGSEHDQGENNEAISEPIHRNEQTPRTILVEPLPPTLRTSKDLFHMLNPSDTDGANISWKALPMFEKKQYGRAIFLLKKDYITKYKEYLESLTSRELFDYYNKTMNKTFS